jgi:hypothetical protein
MGDRPAASAAHFSPAGAAVLDREAFKQVITVPALRVPKQKCSAMLQKFKG